MYPYVSRALSFIKPDNISCACHRVTLHRLIIPQTAPLQQPGSQTQVALSAYTLCNAAQTGAARRSRAASLLLAYFYAARSPGVRGCQVVTCLRYLRFFCSSSFIAAMLCSNLASISSSFSSRSSSLFSMRERESSTSLKMSVTSSSVACG